MAFNMTEDLDSGDVQLCAEVAAAMKRIETIAGTKRERFLAAAVSGLTPTIRQELELSYRRSGLRENGEFKGGDKEGDDKPGNLFKAAVKNSTIRFTGRTICIDLEAGLNDHVYKRAGVFQYGGVWGSGRSKSKASTTFKQRLKGKGTQNLGGGLRTQAPRPFFIFTGDQIDRLAERFIELFNDAIKMGRI